MKNFTEKIVVTGGEYRGRKISTPGGKTHPMGSRERLALFNMLGEKCAGAKVLDAFSGSGALGIEALSRGASLVVFCDNSRRATEVIQRNLSDLGINDGVKVICSKVSDLAGDLEGLGNFEVILADPPYDDFEFTEVDSLVRLLKTSGTLILSHPGEAPNFKGLEPLKTHTYAAAHLSVYTKN